MIKNYKTTTASFDVSQQTHLVARLSPARYNAGGFRLIATFFALFVAIFANAQSSGYTFSQSTETYTPITGGTAIASTVAAALDDATAGALPIGFTFKYNGVDFTQFGYNANGWISLGAAVPASSYVSLSAGTTNNVIAGANSDLIGRQHCVYSSTSASPILTVTAGNTANFTIGAPITGTGIPAGATILSVTPTSITISANATSAGTGRHGRIFDAEVRYETIGTAPNRKLVFQFKNFSRYSTTASTGDRLNFQIILNETTNDINVIYDFAQPNASGDLALQVGLRGNAASDFNNRTSTTSWSATTQGAANTATITLSNTVTPASGLKFSWAVPACVVPTSLATSNITLNSATISWTAPSTAPGSGYEYEVRTSGAAGSGATGLVSSGTTLLLTQDIASLTSSTAYTFYVRSVCSASALSAWTQASFSTLCDTATIPYTVPLAAVTVPAVPQCTFVQNVNTDAATWKSAAAVAGITGNVMAYTYSSTVAANDWFFTRALNLTAGVSYRVKFKYKDALFPEKLKVGIGATPVNTAMTTTLFDVTTGISGTTVAKEIDFTVATSGDHTIGFQCYSTADQNILYLGEISVILTPTDAVDNANLQSFIANTAVVTSLETCQSFDVTARALETGLTEAAGQAAGLVAHIGYSTTNTDPATWPESAWKVATFNADVDNTDEFKATYTPLAAGTYYFASRFVLNGGPAKYGATNNGFWNATTNPNAAIIVSAPAAVTAVAATPTFCAGGNTSITASSANTTLTYLWSEGSTTATITVSPMTTTTYTVTGTNPATGCTSTASVTVTVNSAPAAVIATPDTATICEGQSVAISATTAAVDVNVQFGTAATATTPTTPTPFPNPFSAWYGGAKNQMLYTAAELTAQGLISGSEIKSISFDVAAFVANKACNDFTIRIGNATVATLTAFVPSASLTTVYNTTFTPSATGFVTFTFTAPFTWDGTSNIVIETVHNAGNSGNGSGTTVKYSTTSFVSCFYGAKDSVTPAGVASFDALTTWTNSGSSSNRPNAKFSVESTPAITWTPVTNLFTDANATVAYVAGTPATMVYAKPSETTTYTATAAIGTCTSSDNAVVTVNELPDAPTGAATQAATTIADLVVTPATGVTWYPTPADAVAGTNALASNFAVVDGAIYYATVSNGCTSLPLAVTVDFSLSSPSFNMNKLKYYPNPVNNVLTVSYSQEITGLKLYNMVGQQLMVKKVNATETQLDMSNLPAGSYLLEVSSGANSKTVKLLKNQ